MKTKAVFVGTGAAAGLESLASPSDRAGQLR